MVAPSTGLGCVVGPPRCRATGALAAGCWEPANAGEHGSSPEVQGPCPRCTCPLLLDHMGGVGPGEDWLGCRGCTLRASTCRLLPHPKLSYGCLTAIVAASVPPLAGCSLRRVLASDRCIERRLQVLRVLGRASRVALQGGLVGIMSPLTGFAFVTSMRQCAHPFEVFVAWVIPSRLNDIIVLITVFVNKISFKLQDSLVGWVVVTDIGKIKFHDGLPDGTNQFCKIS